MRARASARARARANEGGEERSTLRSRLPVLAIVVSIAAFAIGYVVTALLFGAGSGPSDVAMVPDVRQLTLQAASRVLDNEELGIEVGDSLPNPTAEAGVILAQSPLPGDEVSPGTAVRVIVSTGQPKLTVPDVSSMSLAQAVRSLEAVGFTVTSEEVPGEGRPGWVFDVRPAVGTAVPMPANVHLRIGGAPPRFEMPVVIGMLEDDARGILGSLGLTVADIEYESSDFGEPGGVIGQDPTPGDSVSAGAEVRLRVTRPREFEERGITRRGGDDRPDREDR